MHDEVREGTIKAVQGMVMTQAVIIWRATSQWTALTRSAEPTPMMEPETTCVVEMNITCSSFVFASILAT